MANSGTFKKGHKKAGGRSAGKENIVTKESRELLKEILDGEVDNIKTSLERVRNDDDFKYLSILEKWMSYVLPKKRDITSDDKSIASITIIENRSKPKADESD